MQRSYLLSIDFKVTSLTDWAAQLKINPLYAILSGFEVGNTPGVGTFYDFTIGNDGVPVCFSNIATVMFISHVFFYIFWTIFTLQCSLSAMLTIIAKDSEKLLCCNIAFYLLPHNSFKI